MSGQLSSAELEKTQAYGLLQQMAAYFLGHEDGRYRSARIVPEPFFVHPWLVVAIEDNDAAGTPGITAVCVEAARYAVPRRKAETGWEWRLATAWDYVHRRLAVRC